MNELESNLSNNTPSIGRELRKKSKESILKGSKSFSLASFFFRKRQREGAWLLYQWCRLCDDLIDSAPNLVEAKKRLAWMRQQTHIALLGDGPLEHSGFEGLRYLGRHYGLSPVLAEDLIQGMELDVMKFQPQTLKELERYCYHVAGVVGLMMCQVMGVKNKNAHLHAVAFGNALQMTNILRDVREDLGLGRIYFPRYWLKELNLNESNFRYGQELWAKLAQKLFLVAEENYRFGREGLKFLDWNCRIACAVAGRVYEQIGVQVIRRKGAAWERRSVVGLGKKILIAAKEILLQTWIAVGRKLK